MQKNNEQSLTFCVSEQDYKALQSLKKSPSTEKLRAKLQEFFTSQSLDQVKHQLWQWFIISSGSDDLSGQSPVEKSDMAYTYKQLTELMEKLYEFQNLK